MQSALRLATRRAVGISSRRGVATTTTTKAATATATASEPEREWVAEKAWVTALVQREVRAQMLAEEERRARVLLRTEVEEWLARRRLADDDAELQSHLMWMRFCTGFVLGGWVVGFAPLFFGR